MDTAKGELVLFPMGDLTPALGRDGPTLPRKLERAGPHRIDLGQLVL